MNWQDRYRDKLVPADEAVTAIQAGDKVLFAALMEPRGVIDAVARRRGSLAGVTMVHFCPLVPFPWFSDPSWCEEIEVLDGYTTLFDRRPTWDRHIDWIPWEFGLGASERQRAEGRASPLVCPDVFCVRLGPPDADGHCSFGPNVWLSPEAIENARVVIAEIDSSLIRTRGARAHVSQLAYLTEAPPAPPPSPRADAWALAEDEARAAEVIGALVAGLIRDGDTIQVGTGTASGAVWNFLAHKNDLGVHSELTLPPTVDLMKAGVVTGRRKTVNAGKLVTTGLAPFATLPGAQEAWAYADDNPAFDFQSIQQVCHVPTIAAHDNMVAINNAVAVDLTGQAVIDHLASGPISGVGGHLAFNIGAHYSRGGRSITCLMTTAKGGEVSRIVPQLDAGAAVHLPRPFIDYLVTEYGVVNLEGRSLRERAELVISVAHPDFRDELRAEARKLFWPQSRVVS
ncbi:MAG: hypothetical protein HYY03_01695 [Chloroflexi bacterium]|nr:hypothetical protein [Chloroflexota bacterium]